MMTVREKEAFTRLKRRVTHLEAVIREIQLVFEA